MEFIDTENPMKTILQAESGKLVGKIHLNHLKIWPPGKPVRLHDGHHALVQKLKDAGADVIVFEFINLHIFDYYTTGKRAPNIEDFMISIKDLDVDYVIYNANDLKLPISDSIKKLVKQRVADEGYITRLNIQHPDKFERHLQWITQRDVTGFMVATSWKDYGADCWGYSHYLKKYLNINHIVIEPLCQPDKRIPLTTSIKPPMGYEKFVDDFMKSTNHEGYTVIDDPEFIPDGKKFITTIYEHPEYERLKIPVSKLI
jgi:hypothetical protein